MATELGGATDRSAGSEPLRVVVQGWWRSAAA
eukprot:COSAG02_NODE_61896_length_267_cov_0.797619_1_plen_31_part_01